MKAEFDRFAKQYHETLSETISVSGEKSEFFVKYRAYKFASWISQYSTDRPKEILDFGCGDGLMTKEVKQAFPLSNIFGVDPSSESIQVASNNYPDINFSVSGKNLKEFKTNQFDALYAAGAFHHIPFEEHIAYTKELNRVLKPNGIAIIYELNPLHPGTRYIFNNSPIDQNATMLYPTYAKKLFSSYGKSTIRYYGFFPQFLSFFRSSEPYLEWIPLGALYAIIVKKHKN